MSVLASPKGEGCCQPYKMLNMTLKRTSGTYLSKRDSLGQPMFFCFW